MPGFTFLRKKQASAHEVITADFCNIGIGFKLALFANLAAVGFSFLMARPVVLSWSDFIERCAVIAAWLEFPLLMSMLGMCLLSQYGKKIPYALKLFFAGLIASLSLGGWQFMLMPIMPDTARFGSLELLMVGFTGVFTYHYFSLRALAFSPALTQAKLQALNARIRPHFLFNSLNTVIALIRIDPQKAERVLQDLCDLFRVFMRDNRGMSPLAQELNLCSQYLAIEQLRLGERLKVSWSLPDLLPSTLVPPLLFQPIVENAILHGIEPTLEGGTIGVRLWLEGKYLNFEVSNPFVSGFSSSNRSNQMALQNIKDRLTLLYDLTAQMIINTEASIYTVKIKIPMNKL